MTDEDHVICAAAVHRAEGRDIRAFRATLIFNDRPERVRYFVAGPRVGEALARFRTIDLWARASPRDTVILTQLD